MIVVVYILGLIALMLALEGILAHMRIRRANGGTAARKRLREMSERLQSPEVAAENSLLRKVQNQRHELQSLLARIPGRERIEVLVLHADGPDGSVVRLADSGQLLWNPCGDRVRVAVEHDLAIHDCQN